MHDRHRYFAIMNEAPPVPAMRETVGMPLNWAQRWIRSFRLWPDTGYLAFEAQGPTHPRFGGFERIGRCP
jgi:hypothetical protein